jgi:hypothetical protein
MKAVAVFPATREVRVIERDIGVFHQRWPQALRALITSRSAPEEAPGVLLSNIGGIKNVITFKTSGSTTEREQSR